MTVQYILFNGPAPTTAAIPKVTTGTAIKTMLQLAPLSTMPPIKMVRWGISFDGIAAATPIQCELLETDVAATVTAHVAAGIMSYSDYSTIAASNFLTLSTAGTGYTASAEGSITATRVADEQLIAPTNQFIYDWSLGSEFQVTPGRFMRIRVTAPAAVNALCYMVFRI